MGSSFSRSSSFSRVDTRSEMDASRARQNLPNDPTAATKFVTRELRIVSPKDYFIKSNFHVLQVINKNTTFKLSVALGDVSLQSNELMNSF